MRNVSKLRHRGAGVVWHKEPSRGEFAMILTRIGTIRGEGRGSLQVAMGHLRRFGGLYRMSALPPIADMGADID
jgi:hypothetical protein